MPHFLLVPDRTAARVRPRAWIRILAAAGVIAAICSGAMSYGAPADPVRDGATRTFPGIFLPGCTALIKSKLTESVRAVPVNLGDAVQRGQVLLRFADDREEVERDRAAALRDKARADLRRVRELHAGGGVSDDALETAETVLKLAEADLRLAEIELAERTITSPHDGVVTERYVDPGTSVELGDPLLRVTSLSPIRVEALLPESMLPAFADPVWVEISPSHPDTVLRVRVHLESPVIDPASGTFPVQIELANRDRRLVTGVSCLLTVAPAVRASP